jgi:hypothetical protein
MSHHTLKTWPGPFEAVWRGDKTFEVRLNDRFFQRGDVVVLKEWERHACTTCKGSDHRDDCTGYSGRQITARVGFTMESTPPRGSQRGFVGNGYVVFSLVDMEKVDGRRTAPSPTDIFGGRS